jgi:hypothetical protein
VKVSSVPYPGVHWIDHATEADGKEQAGNFDEILIEPKVDGLPVRQTEMKTHLAIDLLAN